MKTVNILVNDGRTHNLNKIYGVQISFCKTQDCWEIWKKFDNLQSAKQSIENDTFVRFYAKKKRIVKINYIWHNKEYLGNRKDRTNWFTKLFRI